MEWRFRVISVDVQQPRAGGGWAAETILHTEMVFAKKEKLRIS